MYNRSVLDLLYLEHFLEIGESELAPFLSDKTDFKNYAHAIEITS